MSYADQYRSPSAIPKFLSRCNSTQQCRINESGLTTKVQYNDSSFPLKAGGGEPCQTRPEETPQNAISFAVARIRTPTKLAPKFENGSQNSTLRNTPENLRH